MSEQSQLYDLPEKEQSWFSSRTIQNLLHNQSGWITTIRSDLEDIRSRLAGIKTALTIMAKGGDDTIESDTNRRTRRPQQ